jgi:molecular chaperone GrpE (heat shock protein)
MHTHSPFADQVNRLTNETTELRDEMQRKQQELRAFSKKTDEYIRYAVHNGGVRGWNL